jgi:hypothetical protein
VQQRSTLQEYTERIKTLRNASTPVPTVPFTMYSQLAHNPFLVSILTVQCVHFICLCYVLYLFVLFFSMLNNYLQMCINSHNR